LITIIAAVGANNELGKDNDLVWHLPDDFKRFKALTTGHPIIMGRKTFESFPKLLPNRKHIVITRNKNYTQAGVSVVHSLQDAIDLAKEDPQPFVIGGGEIYSMAMPIVDKIELTRIHANFEVDTYFPKISLEDWELVNEVYHPKDEKHLFDFTYQTFERKKR
jgi:dihydrofolate reductase